MDARQAARRLAIATRAGSVLPLGATTRLYAGTDKGLHGYTGPYQKHLGQLRRRAFVLLEIGVGGYEGPRPTGSLRVWRDWFPRATIVGIDLHHKQIQLGPRVHFVQGSQDDSRVLDRAIEVAGGAPTVVIDDGSHVGEHIIASFEHLFPLMPLGGVYAIEDLHTSYWPSGGGGIPSPDSSGVGLVRQLVDGVQASDPTFDRHPDWGDRPPDPLAPIAAVHVHPGLALIVRG
jgi:hypothetical protein